ncbi:MAG: hypothetical protein COY75_04460, partial [Nitrospirae bacterium CG_4_10_14_0_8_um_filter_41_23]
RSNEKLSVISIISIIALLMQSVKDQNLSLMNHPAASCGVSKLKQKQYSSFPGLTGESRNIGTGFPFSQETLDPAPLIRGWMDSPIKSGNDKGVVE